MTTTDNTAVIRQVEREVELLREENNALRCHVERLRDDRIAGDLEHAGRGDDPEITSDMKAAVMGEFSIPAMMPCLECHGLGAEDDCMDCHGEGQFPIGVEVPWTKCKEIYKAMCAASPGTQPPAPVVPDELEWNQATGRDGLKYKDGWNDCRAAMLNAAPESDQ